jgi:hypothetical protein
MSTLPQIAARMVVKDGVRLGLLSDAERALALALAWAALKQPGRWTEPALNADVLALLGGTLAFLDTDHVELRRWLVDGGWLQRDGYGREYRHVDARELASQVQATAGWAAALDVMPWVAAQRRVHQAERESRRQSWQTRQARQTASP